jgi:hypothetical protein
MGGKTPTMRTTVIEQVEGFLGEYPRILEPGQTQHLCFQATDDGPFWMTPVKRESSRHDVEVGIVESERNKVELVADLEAKGINTKRNTNAS